MHLTNGASVPSRVTSEFSLEVWQGVQAGPCEPSPPASGQVMKGGGSGWPCLLTLVLGIQWETSHRTLWRPGPLAHFNLVKGSGGW